MPKRPSRRSRRRSPGRRCAWANGARRAACACPRPGAMRRARVPCAARSWLRVWSSPAPLLLLAFLAEDAFVGIFDALALVGLRRPVFTDLGGDLTDFLAVAAGNHDLDRTRRGNRDAFRNRIDDIVAVAERDLQVFALHRGAVTDAVDFEPLLEALGDAGDQIGDQGARGTPLRQRALGFEARVDLDLAAVELDSDVVVYRDLQRTLGAFDLHGLALDIRGNAGRHRNCFFANTRHQNTVQRISPPTLASRASWSAMTPFGVDTMVTPSPLLMRGMFLTEV